MQKPALALSLLAIAAAAASALAAPEAAPNPAAAHVCFLFPSYSNVSYDTGAQPMIYANGAPVGAISGGSEFCRDFAPGSYSFTVDPYGQPTGQSASLQLTPGTQTYMQVQYSPTWEWGYAPGRGQMSSSFFIAPMAPQLAQVYMPTLANIGTR